MLLSRYRRRAIGMGLALACAFASAGATAGDSGDAVALDVLPAPVAAAI